MSPTIPRRRAFICGLAVLPIGAAAFSEETSSDAELLRLGKLFEQAWEREAEFWRAFPEAETSEGENARLWAAAERAARVTHGIADEIERHQAVTLAGVLVKMRVCSWSHSGEPFDGGFLWGHEDRRPTTDFRLAEAVLRDLKAIDGRPTPVSG